jgi:diguanylate cyclase (GGDEF)-like protein
MIDLAPLKPSSTSPAPGQWQDLISLAADFAFETDEWDRFVMIEPDHALGWPADELIGQPARLLLAEPGGTAGTPAASFNPFRVTSPARHRQAWLKRADGTIACLWFSAAPIRDATGRIIGARGLGIDVTALDSQTARAGAALRRTELLDHILWRMGQEATAARMMAAILDTLANALGAEGTAVILLPLEAASPRLVYVTGHGADSVMDAANRQLLLGDPKPVQTAMADGRPMLIAACQTRSGERAGLIGWRGAAAHAWDPEDHLLLASSVNLVRMVLEHEAIQHEMALQARTDPLTGLLNRRAFLEEIERHVGRLDKENSPGTLLFADLDHFKPVNERLGHGTGDQVLRSTAALLRKTFRPGDLIARLGGDEFAVWLNGADHMTAAERAEFLRDAVPRDLEEIVGPDGPRLTLSIGIASREPNDDEPLDSLMRRADMAMYEVKRGGRGHWRVSHRGRP